MSSESEAEEGVEKKGKADESQVVINIIFQIFQLGVLKHWELIFIYHNLNLKMSYSRPRESGIFYGMLIISPNDYLPHPSPHCPSYGYTHEQISLL